MFIKISIFFKKAIDKPLILWYTNWDGKNWYYFDSKAFTEKETCRVGNTSECKYGWLYDRTGLVCKSKGCLNNSNVETSGYWTATYISVAGTTEGHTENCNGIVSFGVSHRGRIGFACVNQVDLYGVIPAISVKRSKIS